MSIFKNFPLIFGIVGVVTGSVAGLILGSDIRDTLYLCFIAGLVGSIVGLIISAIFRVEGK